jgi:hypothetical protein
VQLFFRETYLNWVLLICSFLVFIVAPPSLQLLNHWFQSQIALLSHTCEPYTDQYIALNHITAQASHVETFLGLLASAGLIMALVCMPRYTGSRSSVNGANGQQSSTRSVPLFWNSILAMLLLIATSLVYALSPSLDGAGCDEGCGFLVLSLRLLGSVLGTLALVVALLALMRGLTIMIQWRQWDWFVGTLLLLVVNGGFFLQLLLGPGRLNYRYEFPDVSPFLTLPANALVFTVLTFIPVAILLSALARSKQTMV